MVPIAGIGPKRQWSQRTVGRNAWNYDDSAAKKGCHYSVRCSFDYYSQGCTAVSSGNLTAKRTFSADPP